MIHEIQAKTLLRKYKKADSWFLGRYGMNFYRGCVHNCVYCDGRDDKYQVQGEFGKDIAVKINAPDLLRKEIFPSRRRKPLRQGFLLLGGGVGDSYQPAEKNYKIMRKSLKVIAETNFSVHILTKSTLIERDISILKQLNEKTKVIVSFSFSSVDKSLCKMLEPAVPTPEKRLETMQRLQREGISTGMLLMPVVPFISDKQEKIEQSLIAAKNAGASYVLFAGMTLKQGRQKDYFLTTIKKRFPGLEHEYNIIYSGNKWGGTHPDYSASLNNQFYHLSKKHKIPARIPTGLFADYVEENDKVSILLDQIDYYLRLQGRKSPYGYAAYSISQLKEPVSSMKHHLQQIKGVGKVTERLIKEIVKTGKSNYLEKLMS